MKNKKILALILGFALSISLVGCGNNSDNTPVAGDSNATKPEVQININTNRDQVDTNIERPSDILIDNVKDAQNAVAEAERQEQEALKKMEEALNKEEKKYINEKLGIKFSDFYADAEEIEYAQKLIGREMPTFNWSKFGTPKSNDDFGNDKYIIELFRPDCGYCHQSIPEVDDFRITYPEIPVISLTSMIGDIEEFNQNTYDTFRIEGLSDEINELLEYIPWVPAFIYVENDTIQLITYGGVTKANLEKYVDIAFNK